MGFILGNYMIYAVFAYFKDSIEVSKVNTREDLLNQVYKFRKAKTIKIYCWNN